MRCMAADVADSKDPLQADVGQLNAFSRPWSPNYSNMTLTRLDIGMFRLGFLVWLPSFGFLRLASFVCFPSIAFLRLTSFVWLPSLGFLRLTSFVWLPSFGFLRMASFVWLPPASLSI